MFMRSSQKRGESISEKKKIMNLFYFQKEDVEGARKM